MPAYPGAIPNVGITGGGRFTFPILQPLGNLFGAGAGTNWYVRVGGSNNNGGTGTSLTAERTGTDGATTTSTPTFTSVSATFTAADVGKGICIATGSSARHHKIAAFANSTTVTLDRNVTATLSSQTWAIGGGWADVRAGLADSNANTDTNSPVHAADRIWVGAGTYRVTIAVGANWGRSQGANIVGDTDGAMTGDAGMVQWTAYTTNDKTASSATTLLNLNGHSGLSFQRIMFVGGNAAAITATVLTSQNISFVDCQIFSGVTGALGLVTATCGFQVPFNWKFDGCSFITNVSAGSFTITLTTGAGADYDANFLIQNSIVIGRGAAFFTVTNSGTLANKGGGIKFRNVFHFGGQMLSTVASQISTTIPCTVYNCLIHTGSSTALSAGTSGQIVENNNLIVATTPRANVTAGLSSISDGSYAPLFHFGQELKWGGLLRPFGEPMVGSPLLGFPADGSQTNYDMLGRPRNIVASSTVTPAAGALERGNFYTKETTTVHTGSNAISAVGAASHDFLLSVTAGTSYTLSVFANYAAGYLATNPKPSIELLNGGENGISNQKVSAADGQAGNWTQLSLNPFTPVTSGFVTIRFTNYDSTGLTKTSFDSFAVA